MNYYETRIAAIRAIEPPVDKNIFSAGLKTMRNHEVLELKPDTICAPTVWLLRDVSDIEAAKAAAIKNVVYIEGVKDVYDRQATFRFGEWQGATIPHLIVRFPPYTNANGEQIVHKQSLSSKYILGQHFHAITSIDMNESKNVDRVIIFYTGDEKRNIVKTSHIETEKDIRNENKMLVQTTCLHLLSLDLLESFDKIMVNHNGTMHNIQLGRNDWTPKDIRKSHNIYKLIMSYIVNK